MEQGISWIAVSRKLSVFLAVLRGLGPFIDIDARGFIAPPTPRGSAYPLKRNRITSVSSLLFKHLSFLGRPRRSRRARPGELEYINLHFLGVSFHESSDDLTVR
jgi:hypothetical protein